MIIDESWTRFTAQLPSNGDADENGNVEALESNGWKRPVMWNWVQTAELWNTNGFVAWRRK